MTKDMQTLALAPVGNTESYIRAANTWPMLSADEERELLKSCITVAIWKQRKS